MDVMYPTISPSDGSNWGTGVAGATKDGGEVDKLSFLRLLVTELKNQNPMDPIDNREFLAQLAQFNSLEQMQNLNAQLEGLHRNIVAAEVANGAKFDQMNDTLAKLLAVQQAQPQLLL